MTNNDDIWTVLTSQRCAMNDNVISERVSSGLSGT